MAFSRRVVPCLLLSLCSAVRAEPGEVVFVAATNHNMPLSHFQEGELAEGLLKDLGDAIAHRLGRRVRYVSVPAKRVAGKLLDGTADGVCYVLPRWLEGDFNWSQPVIPDAGVLVSRADAPPVRSLPELANKPVGTVRGYSYSVIDSVLGKAFVHDDAPSMESNISKIQHGRMQYAIMGKMSAQYVLRSDPQRALRVDFEFDPFKTQCAFSKKSGIPFSEVQQAIGGLLMDGSVERMMQRYR